MPTQEHAPSLGKTSTRMALLRYFCPTTEEKPRVLFSFAITLFTDPQVHRTTIIRKGRGNYSRLVSHTSLLTLQFLWLLSSNWAPDTRWPQLHPTYVPMNKHTWEFSTMWTPCCSMYLLRSPKNSTTSSGVASQGKPLNLTQLRSEPRLAATTHEALDVSGLRKLNWSSCSGLPDLLST